MTSRQMVCVLVKCINLLWLKIILLLSSVPRTTPAPCPKTPSGKCFYTYFSKPQSNNLEKKRNSFLLSKEKHSKFEIQSEIFRKDKANLLISMCGKIHVLRSQNVGKAEGNHWGMNMNIVCHKPQTNVRELKEFLYSVQTFIFMWVE